MFRRLRAVLRERHIGSLVVALLTANTVLMGFAIVVPRLKSLLIILYNYKRPPLSFEVNPHLYGIYELSVITPRDGALLLLSAVFAYVFYRWTVSSPDKEAKDE